jgi:hypothetical protein
VRYGRRSLEGSIIEEGDRILFREALGRLVFLLQPFLVPRYWGGCIFNDNILNLLVTI